MMFGRRIGRDERGAAAVEMAFAMPVLVVMIWAFVQLAQVYRALAGIQQALGEGARYATLCLNPVATGCTAPTAATVKTKIETSVYGIGPGTFSVPTRLAALREPVNITTFRSLHAADQPAAFPRTDDQRQSQKRVWLAAV